MNLWALFVSSLILGFSGAMPPGSLLSLVVAQSVQRGFWAGPLLITGHALLELAMVVGLTLGLSRLLRRKGVAGAIGLLGGVFLLWMAYSLLSDAPRAQLAAQAGAGAALSAAQLVLWGALTSAANPYWVMWWAFAGVTYVTAAGKQGLPGLSAFFTGHILADYLWYALVSGAIAAGREVMPLWLYRGLLGLCGAFLLCLAGYFLRFGLKTLRSRGEGELTLGGAQ
ncbi:MAG: LysE family transporter [Bacillota bacterium]|nr:LysE family transporter [Bacillota bacterium]